MKLVPFSTVFRKIALAAWDPPRDPSVFGFVEFDVTHALETLKQASQNSKVKLTMSHFVGHVVAQAFKKYPFLNRYALSNKIFQRDEVDLFFQAWIPAKDSTNVDLGELSGIIVRSACQKSLIEIAENLESQVINVKKHGDHHLARALKTMKWLPVPLIRMVLSLTKYFEGRFNMSFEWIGRPKNAFGSVMITNVGPLGLDLGFPALVPFANVPLLISIGTFQNRPWNVDGRVEIRPVIRIGITFDHRVFDGAHMMALNEALKAGFKA